MQKSIWIDGQEVRFATSGAVPIRYKKQFGKDFFADMIALSKAFKKVEGQDETEIMANINLDVFYNMAWVFAKTANKEVGGLEEWLDSFTQFPIMEVLTELQPLLYHTFQTKKN